jgi:hypothetical protein
MEMKDPSEQLSFEMLLGKLGKDMKAAAGLLGHYEARALFDTYYRIQKMRCAANNQLTAAAGNNKPHQLSSWTERSLWGLECAIKGSLGLFAQQYRLGRWLQSLDGIGPVISAGLLTVFDMRRTTNVGSDVSTVGHWWSYAGCNPAQPPWVSGTPRPFSMRAKTLVLFRMGETLIKRANAPKNFYGPLYLQKKASLWEENTAGKFAATALQEVHDPKRKVKEETQKYVWNKGCFDPDDVRAWLAAVQEWKDTCRAIKQENAEHKKAKDGITLELPPEPDPLVPGKIGCGTPMLSPRHIYERARRWMVKLFISHFHEVAHWDFFGTAPPAPFVFAHPTSPHVHLIAPPNWSGNFDAFPGKTLADLYATAPFKLKGKAPHAKSDECSEADTDNGDAVVTD